MESVYSAVRTGDLNKAVCACATYSINWLVFIAEMESVYCAVRTGPTNRRKEEEKMKKKGRRRLSK
jgi:hypothetical protein